MQSTLVSSCFKFLYLITGIRNKWWHNNLTAPLNFDDGMMIASFSKKFSSSSWWCNLAAHKVKMLDHSAKHWSLFIKMFSVLLQVFYCEDRTIIESMAGLLFFFKPKFNKVFLLWIRGKIVTFCVYFNDFFVCLKNFISWLRSYIIPPFQIKWTCFHVCQRKAFFL